MDAHTPRPEVDPLENTPLHRLLVNTNRLQAIPASIVALIIIFNAFLVAFFWLPFGTNGVAVLVVYVAVIALNWFLLLKLRLTGRRFGPDRPTAIALAIV